MLADGARYSADGYDSCVFFPIHLVIRLLMLLNRIWWTYDVKIADEITSYLAATKNQMQPATKLKYSREYIIQGIYIYICIYMQPYIYTHIWYIHTWNKKSGRKISTPKIYMGNYRNFSRVKFARHDPHTVYLFSCQNEENIWRWPWLVSEYLNATVHYNDHNNKNIIISTKIIFVRARHSLMAKLCQTWVWFLQHLIAFTDHPSVKIGCIFTKFMGEYAFKISRNCCDVWNIVTAIVMSLKMSAS